MTDHADTIRDRKPVGIVVSDEPGIGYTDAILLSEAERDALLAERQQAIDERDEALMYASRYEQDKAELRAQLEQAIDALRERRSFAALVLECDNYGCEAGPSKCLHAKALAECQAIDAALEILGEQP